MSLYLNGPKIFSSSERKISNYIGIIILIYGNVKSIGTGKNGNSIVTWRESGNAKSVATWKEWKLILPRGKQGM